MYTVQEWRDGAWGDHRGDVGSLVSLVYAVEILVELDTKQEPRPRRVTGPDGRTIFSGRHCSRDTPVHDIKPMWIVLSLDKIGPCERGERPYAQHPTKDAAVSEARRLSMACGGGRFGVLELIHVVGWIDHQINLDDYIPF